MIKEQKRFLDNTLHMAFRVLAIAGAPAIVAAIAGKYIDNQFGIAPFGSLGLLLIAFVSSWTIIIFYYKRFLASIPKERQQHD